MKAISVKHRYFNSDDSINLFVYLEDRCNYECSYCYNEHPRTLNELDVDVLGDFVEKLKTETNKKVNVELIGGEPTLHKSLMGFVVRLRDINCDVLVYTNLSQELEFYEDMLQMGVKLFATHHYKSKKFVHKLNKLIKYKSQIDVCVMVDNDDAFYRFDEIKSNGYNPTICLINSSTKGLTEKQIQQFNERKFQESPNIEVEYDDGSIEYLTEEQIVDDYELNNFKYWKCDAGKSLLFINHNGDIYPCQTYCTYNKQSIGNIYNKDKCIPQLKSIVCSCDFCECGHNIKKENVFYEKVSRKISK